MSSKVWDEIAYPFPNFNRCNVEVWEWISNFSTNFILHVITYKCWDPKYVRTVPDGAKEKGQPNHASGLNSNVICGPFY